MVYVSIWVPPRGHFGPKESRVPKKSPLLAVENDTRSRWQPGALPLDPVNRGAATDRQGCDPWTSLFYNYLSISEYS